MAGTTRSASDLADEEIREGLKTAFLSGCGRLEIFSRRQDIGIRKCAWGVEHGYLTERIVDIDEQEQQWHYYWTEKARTE